MSDRADQTSRGRSADASATPRVPPTNRKKATTTKKAPTPTGRPDAAARFLASGRRPTGRRRALVTALVVALVLVLVGGGIWVVRFSPVLDARAVAVERPATALLSERQVLTAAQVPLGRPLAAVDLQAVADRVARLPEVATVTVSQQLPHTIRVAVTERTPAYALKAGSHYQLVDRDGIGYHRVDRVPSGLAAVTADDADHALRVGLAGVVAALPDEVSGRLTRIEAPTRDQVTLELDGGVKVIWGSPADSELKGQVAVVLLEVKDVKTVDVSAPSHPTTR